MVELVRILILLIFSVLFVPFDNHVYLSLFLQLAQALMHGIVFHFYDLPNFTKLRVALVEFYLLVSITVKNLK